MTDTDVTRGRSSTIALIAAVLAVGGLMACERPSSSGAEGESADSVAMPADPDAGVTVVTGEELNTPARVRELRGQDVRADNLTVVSAMGTQLFWVELPGGAPFLVKLDSALVASGTQAPQTGTYTIVGRVAEKTPELLNQWQQAGALRNEGDRMQAEFGTSYIEARRVTPAGG